MFTKLGIISILIGGFVGIFSIISGFMQADNIWVGITLSSITGGLADSIIDSVSVQPVQDFLYALFYDFPLGGVIIALGILFFVASLFVKEH